MFNEFNFMQNSVCHGNQIKNLGRSYSTKNGPAQRSNYDIDLNQESINNLLV